MQIMKHIHQVPFDDIPELLIEFSREAIWAWCFIMFHIENCIPNFLFCEWSCKEFIFRRTDLRNIIRPL